MLLITAFLVSASAVSAQSAIGGEALPKVFVAACLNGEARLPAGQASPVSFEDLPSRLRERLGVPSSGKVWRLNGPGRAYLYVLSYEPRRGINPKVCGLAADRMDLNAAADALETRITGSVPSNGIRGTEWLMPEDGYTAVATTADEFKVAQVNWLSEEQRAKALQSVRSLPQ